MLAHDDARFYFRVFSVNFLLNGMSAANVAEIAGVSRSTGSHWVKTIDEKEFEALKEPLNQSRLSNQYLSCFHLFRHLAPKFLEIRQYSCGILIQSDSAIQALDFISAF